ncbi:MAG: helix-turn-helix domain-containing protein [Caldilineaceae bacterium]
MTNPLNQYHRTKYEQRKLLFQTWLETDNIAYSCRHAGVSRDTFYQWKERFLRGGFEALAEYGKHAPKGPPRASDRVVKQVTYLKQTQPNWGFRKIARFINDCQIFPDSVKPDTVRLILIEAGLFPEATSAEAKKG